MLYMINLKNTFRTEKDYKCIRLYDQESSYYENSKEILYKYDFDIVLYRLSNQFLNLYHYTDNEDGTYTFRYLLRDDYDAVSNIYIKLPLPIILTSIKLYQYKRNITYIKDVDYKYLYTDDVILISENNTINLISHPYGNYLHFTITNIEKEKMEYFLTKIILSYDIVFFNHRLKEDVRVNNLLISLK